MMDGWGGDRDGGKSGVQRVGIVVSAEQIYLSL